jgi:TonB family protein
LIFAASSSAQSPLPYYSQIDTFADRLASDIQKSPGPQKVLLVDFTNDLGNTNVLGQQVANDLAHALETRLPPGGLISRQQFRENLISAGLAPFDLRDRAVLAANAAQTGATMMITGRILRFKNSNTLQIDIASLPGAQSTSSASTDLTFAPEALSLLTTLIDWPIAPFAVTHCGKPVAIRDVFAATGVTLAKCVKCQAPPYDKDAGRAGWQGTVVLNVSIDERGRNSVVSVARNGPFHVDDIVTKTVEKWQMQPATLNGKPVKVCMQIEVNFHLGSPTH